MTAAAAFSRSETDPSDVGSLFSFLLQETVFKVIFGIQKQYTDKNEHNMWFMFASY